MNTFSLDYFLEKQSSWELLGETSLPIFLYGMGDGALKILKQFEHFGISCDGIFASDEFVRGHSFAGYKVRKLSEIEAEHENFVIVLAFAAGYESLIERINSIAERHILVAPDVPVVGEGLFTKEFLTENFEKFETVFGLLEDELSREVFCKTIEFKITGDIRLLNEITTLPAEAFENILKPQKDEVYVDLGAYNGDTVLEFIEQADGNYRKIYALEPDRRNFRKLLKSTENLVNFEAINAAGWSEDCSLFFSDKAGRQSAVSEKGLETAARSVDSVLDGGAASYIKYDVEGAEKHALFGSEKTIKVFKPKLTVAIYHRDEDLFELPLLIKSQNPEYRLFMRHFPYIPAWEINLFCI